MTKQKEQTTKELCARCRKNEATLTYANSQMDVIHGFTERICQECYDKQMKESNWYKKGFEEGRKIMEQTNHSQQDVEKVANDTNSSSNRLNLGAKPADSHNQTAEEITGELGIAENRLLLLSMIADGFDNDAPKVLDKILSLKEQDDKRITSAVVKSMDAGYKLALKIAEQQAKQDILRQVEDKIERKIKNEEGYIEKATKNNNKPKDLSIHKKCFEYCKGTLEELKQSIKEISEQT